MDRFGPSRNEQRAIGVHGWSAERFDVLQRGPSVLEAERTAVRRSPFQVQPCGNAFEHRKVQCVPNPFECGPSLEQRVFGAWVIAGLEQVQSQFGLHVRVIPGVAQIGTDRECRRDVLECALWSSEHVAHVRPQLQSSGPHFLEAWRTIIEDVQRLEQRGEADFGVGVLAGVVRDDRSDVAQFGLLQIGDLLGLQGLHDHAFGLLEPPALQVRSSDHRHADVRAFVWMLRRVFVPKVEHASVIVMQMLDANSGFKNPFGVQTGI